MTFSEFLNQSWQDHGQETVRVAASFETGLKLVQHPEDLAQMAALATHVLGQHLGRFEEALAFLEELRQHPRFSSSSDAAATILRSAAALQLASSTASNLDAFPAPDQTRIYALAAAILCERDSTQAREYLITAMSIAAAELDQADPAIKSLAATTHNLAAALEVKRTLSAEEERLMLEAALASHKYWEIAGTWVEVKQAEYRLAMTCAKARRFNEAMEHANNGLHLCEQNKGSALEYFYAYECQALVERARGNGKGFEDAAAKARSQYSQLTIDDKKYCEESLKALG